MGELVSMELTREVRFSIGADSGESGSMNSWAGWPVAVGFGPYVVLRATVRGVVDKQTGYLCNIVTIDRAVRTHVIPLIHNAVGATSPRGVGDGKRCQGAMTNGVASESVLSDIVAPLSAALPEHVDLVQLEMRVTPFLAYTWRKDRPVNVSVTQSFEFAAAHRLYCDSMTAEENHRVFGKCTNPNGHGHNYMVEVTVSGEPDATSGVVLEVGRFEGIVNERVIDVFDHKHLNMDCAEFAETNPSVENITRVIWDRLDGAFSPANLSKVRVYETPKTYAEYTG